MGSFCKDPSGPNCPAMCDPTCDPTTEELCQSSQCPDPYGCPVTNNCVPKGHCNNMYG